MIAVLTGSHWLCNVYFVGYYNDNRNISMCSHCYTWQFISCVKLEVHVSLNVKISYITSMLADKVRPNYAWIW